MHNVLKRLESNFHTTASIIFYLPQGICLLYKLRIFTAKQMQVVQHSQIHICNTYLQSWKDLVPCGVVMYQTVELIDLF